MRSVCRYRNCWSRRASLMSDHSKEPAMKIVTDKSKMAKFKLAVEPKGSERREHRRYELGGQTLSVNRWDTRKREPLDFGYLMDLSAGGVRVRTNQANIKADHQIRVR